MQRTMPIRSSLHDNRLGPVGLRNTATSSHEIALGRALRRLVVMMKPAGQLSCLIGDLYTIGD